MLAGEEVTRLALNLINPPADPGQTTAATASSLRATAATARPRAATLTVSLMSGSGLVDGMRTLAATLLPLAGGGCSGRAGGGQV